MKAILTVIILLCASFAIYKVASKPEIPAVQSVQTQTAQAVNPAKAVVAEKAPAETVTFVDPSLQVGPLDPVGTYSPKDNTITIEISEYAGYAGLIAANNGLSPNENSYFYQKHGFKLNLVVSEDESWSSLNNGRIAGATSTVDVLSKSLQAVVPVQLSYSRGADAVVVKSSITRVNDLKGKAVITAQFTETDFLIRYLAQEANIKVQGISSIEECQPDAINLLFTDEGFAAGDNFLKLMDNPKVAGCVTWEPKVSEIVASSNGQAKVLISNRNLLIVADVLMLNKGFARENPKIVAGLVDGILYGNSLLTNQPSKMFDALKQAYKWSEATAKSELSKVHLSNYPENVQFFRGDVDAVNTYGAIFQAALYAYPSELRHSIPWEKTIVTDCFDALAPSYSTQVANIQPIRTQTTNSNLENNPLLSKNIRFLFKPNSYELADDPQNEKFCAEVANLLKISPGSTVLLRGHVDNARVSEFKVQGGDAMVRSMAIRALQLSKQRAESVQHCLITKQGVAKERLDIVGRGWEEPTEGTAEENRRVEVYWFTVE
jgi:NitT/TauT family transport system substrate-binding protein